MKVTGGRPPGIPESTSDAPENVKGPEGSGFANKLEETGAAQPATTAEAPAAAARSATPSFIGDISAKLREGKLTPQEAVDQVMNRILDRQLGEGAPAGVRSEVESAMKNALDSDPVLTAKMGHLRAE
jgi:hypothetical protein